MNAKQFINIFKLHVVITCNLDAARLRPQALKERDELLRRSEADLVAAREEARERGTETERLGTEAAELRANMRDLFTNQEVQQTEVDNLRHEVLELQQRLQEANACCEETGNSLEQQTDFLKAELGVSRAEEAARAQEVVQLQHTLQHTDAEMECMHGQIAGLQHQVTRALCGSRPTSMCVHEACPHRLSSAPSHVRECFFR
ncbi:uncharacterized protein LOC142929245 [Petromyzon marinus]|uniref:uncharacterized protein LOC142905797 n=1 Tax=Petromyzon marinus TaxID=7757 RepID=UPI003F71DCD0